MINISKCLRHERRVLFFVPRRYQGSASQEVDYVDWDPLDYS